MKYTIIGVPYTSSGLTTGEALAPAALRAAGLIDALRRSAEVLDRGDVAFVSPTPIRDSASGIIAPETLVSLTGAVRSAVGDALGAGEFPIVIGGECPLLLGCLAAVRDCFGHSGLLFVDGHEDAWPPNGSTTGEAADMELGLALGLTEVANLKGLADILPLVQPEDAVILGPRDRDEVEAEGVASLASSVTMCEDGALQIGNIEGITSTLAQRLYRTAGYWWFHLDLDVLSSEALAAVRYPQPGGLDWDQLGVLTRAALATPGLIGWNITIYNPDLDPDRDGAEQIISFLERMAEYLP